jgi:hypothetical protein
MQHATDSTQYLGTSFCNLQVSDKEPTNEFLVLLVLEDCRSALNFALRFAIDKAHG